MELTVRNYCYQALTSHPATVFPLRRRKLPGYKIFESVMVDETEQEEKFRAGKLRIIGGQFVVRSRVAFSKDTRSLFCAYGNQVRVYSVKTGELVSVFHGHSGEVADLCLGERNALQLVSCCVKGDVIFWDISDGSVVTKCKSTRPLHGVSVHKDHPDTLFLVCRDGSEKGQELFCFGKANVKSKNKGLKEVPSCLGFNKICRIEKGRDAYSFSSKGEHVACIERCCLQIWHFGNGTLKKYPSKAPLASVAFHPFDLCLATGHDNGKIKIWRNLDVDAGPVLTKLHWHAHPVGSLKFSYDGAYMYSGGEESVLVFWQFETEHKQFKPRLGAPIAHICNSRDDTVIAVCHKDNVINLVSAVDLSVVNVVQGLTKASHLYTGLVGDPLSNSLVFNSQDGILQFYRPDTDSLAFTLDIVGQNYISKPKGEPLLMTAVEQVSFSKDGSWLATVERRDDEKTTPEIRLKFWKFAKDTQRHVLNTCIDPPHNGKVVTVEFQPGSFEMSRAMSASVDGKFKIWVLREQRVIKGVREAWQCQSVGYLREEPVEDAGFSSDGSLLAVAYGQVVTLWDPCTNELKTMLYSPFSQPIRKIKFGRQSCSHILLASTKFEFLVAWNLLSCTVLWSVKAEVLSILADPSSHLMAVFVRVFHGRKIHLYIFDPRSAVPVAIHPCALRKTRLASAGFQPNMKGLTVCTDHRDVTMARLFFMDRKQVLYTIDDEETDSAPLIGETSAKPEESEFFRVFGSVRESALPPEVPEPSAVHKDTSSKVIREVTRNQRLVDSLTYFLQFAEVNKKLRIKQLFSKVMLSSPSHVLPPVPTLCSKFLRSLLVCKNSDRPLPVANEHDSDEEQEASTGPYASTSDEESSSGPLEIQTGLSRDGVEDGKNDEKKLFSEQKLNQLHQTNFKWMEDLFSTIS